MRTCVMLSTDYSHLSRAQPALMVTLCSPPHPASAGRGPFELPREPWVFPTCPFHTRSFGVPQRIVTRMLAVRWSRSELWFLG